METAVNLNSLHDRPIKRFPLGTHLRDPQEIHLPAMSPFLPHGHQRLFMGWPWETEGKVHEAGRSPTVGSPGGFLLSLCALLESQVLKSLSNSGVNSLWYLRLTPELVKDFMFDLWAALGSPGGWSRARKKGPKFPG